MCYPFHNLDTKVRSDIIMVYEKLWWIEQGDNVPEPIKTKAKEFEDMLHDYLIRNRKERIVK